MNLPQCLKRMVEFLSSFSLYRKSKKHPSDFENTNQLVNSSTSSSIKNMILKTLALISDMKSPPSILTFVDLVP